MSKRAVSMDRRLLGVLDCPQGCKSEQALTFVGGPGDEAALVCPKCQRSYAVRGGVPILFPDQQRRDFTLDSPRQNQIVAQIDELGYKAFHEKQRHRYVGHVLSGPVEALAWEYYICRKQGLGIPPAQQKVLLRNKQSFFDLVRPCVPLQGKLVLNIGSGADFILLDWFRQEGAQMLAQDVVLDLPLAMAARGALGLCCDCRRLPLKDNSVDIVIAYAMLHHVWPFTQPLEEVARVLKPGGYFFCQEPNARSLPNRVKAILPSPLLKPVWRLAQEHLACVTPYEKALDPHRLRSYLLTASLFSEAELIFPQFLIAAFRFPWLVRWATTRFPSLGPVFQIWARKGNGR